ncbi:MAG: HAD family phosphatase [Caldilinea sp.]|jgi:putative hydrolase of the HAD superfamily|nr:HAD family phosphatase [Caldilinea sp.]
MRFILFDIGNVLVRYDHQRTMTALADLYHTDPVQLSTFYNQIGRQFGVGEITPTQVVDMLNSRFNTSHSLEEFTKAFCAGLMRDDAALAYAVALQVEDELAVGAISNTNAVHVAWLDDRAPELNEFELVIMSNEVGLRKPDPEIYELAMEILNASPAQILYVDDLAENVEAARQLGMSAILHHDWAKTRALIDAWRSS